MQFKSHTAVKTIPLASCLIYLGVRNMLKRVLEILVSFCKQFCKFTW